MSWNSFDDKDFARPNPDDVKGDLSMEQYFEKIVLLQKGDCIHSYVFVYTSILICICLSEDFDGMLFMNRYD